MPRKVRLSGAAEKKLRNEKQISELLAQRGKVDEQLMALGWQPTTAAAPGADTGAAREAPDWAAEFEDAFAHDGEELDDPTLAMRCVRRAQFIALRQRCTTPCPTPEQLAVWKGIETQAKAMGATRLTAELEELAGEVQELLQRRRRVTAAPVTPTAGRPRPPTARGGTGRRGPQLLPDPPEGGGAA